MRVVLCAAIAVQLTACATVLKTSHEPIAVDSQPGAADVVIKCRDGTHATGVTPTHITIPRTAEHCVVTVSKAGYATKTVPLEVVFNAAYWSNFAVVPGLILGPYSGLGEGNHAAAVAITALGAAGVAGFIVDRVNGRGYRHTPDEINVTLDPVR